MGCSSSKATILVVAASGNAGKPIVQALVKAGFLVRATSRDANSEKAKALIMEGVEVVSAGDIESIKAAALGCVGAVICTPGSEDRGPWTSAVADALNSAGITKMVVITVPGAKPDATILFGRQFGDAEKGIADKGIKACLLRLPMFMENLYGSLGSIKGEGKYFWMPAADAKYSPVCLKDVADAVAAIARDFDAHCGKEYLLCSKPTSANEICASLSEAGGKPVTVVQIDEAMVLSAMGTMMPEWQAKGMVELLKLVDPGYLNFWKEDGANDLPTLLGREPVTMDAFIKGDFKAALA